jgi:protein-L-isoaspartate(D-aspartate) O-methyltransferase
MSFVHRRQRMVETQLRHRGIRDPRVLEAMGRVEREALVSPELAEFAYDDRPLPIAAGQTISQPYIVALMAEALEIEPGDRVLEIGTGSGYAAAVLAELADRVYTVERHAELARTAQARLAALGYDNIEVLCGDGTRGWPEHAPYQAIAVAAGGPEAPPALLEQLAVGGRLVIPVGPQRIQRLVRITRLSETELQREDLGGVRFVPLIGEQGWGESVGSAGGVEHLINECLEPISGIDDVDLAPLLERIGDARVVLLGEATHGTSEFYRMRARITRELILRRGFQIVAIEADWPDAAAVDHHLRGRGHPPRPWIPFSRFPTWMWRNRETADLIDWIYHYNRELARPDRAVRFAGLDLYSLYTSAHEVVRYLDRIDPALAATARERYGCLTPWQADPAVYGRAALSGRYRTCEGEVAGMLRDLLARRLEYIERDGDDFLEEIGNARVVAGAERYYRTMYYGGAASWNLRDQHMFDTLTALLDHVGPDSRAVVWEHNSHIGDAAATEMAARGEHNVGRLCRAAFGDDVYSIGFGTDRGTDAAAHDWGDPMEVMRLRPSHPESYERLCAGARAEAFLLALRQPAREALRDELGEPRLERAIGVVYRPESELASHYFHAVLPVQFDEYIWFAETAAVEALAPATRAVEHPLSI